MQPRTSSNDANPNDDAEAPNSDGTGAHAGADTNLTTAEVREAGGTFRLLTGETVQVRAIRPDDTERLQAFHARLSADSIVFRFFRYLPTLPLADAQRFTHVDYRDRMALVAVTPASSWSGAASGTGQAGADESAILGVVRYERMDQDRAEVAFVVEDHWQGHGIATALLHRLAAYARRHGITQFVAITMATNSRMLEVLRNAGYPLTVRVSQGEATVTLDISHPTAGEPGTEDTEQGAFGAR